MRLGRGCACSSRAYANTRVALLGRVVVINERGRGGLAELESARTAGRLTGVLAGVCVYDLTQST